MIKEFQVPEAYRIPYAAVVKVNLLSLDIFYADESLLIQNQQFKLFMVIFLRLIPMFQNLVTLIRWKLKLADMAAKSKEQKKGSC